MSAVPPESPRASAEPIERTSERSGAKDRAASANPDFGPNEWLVDELYQRYLADPGSVDMAWWNFFADYSPPAGSPAARAAAQQGLPAAPAPAPGGEGRPAGPPA